MSKSLNSLKKLTTQAFNYIRDSPHQPPSSVANTQYSLPLKYKYERPSFLELDAEATTASADHEIRPIIHPKRPLLMNAGYAEVINAGKTLQINEDQATVHSFVITVPLTRRYEGWTDNMCEIPCIYFAVFDGHAGTGASISAYHNLHIHVKDKLTEVSHMLVLSKEKMREKHLSTGLILSIDAEKLIIGALEKAFVAMDEEIRLQRFDFRITGGCTALVSLFIKGKLYVACAGDARAMIYHSNTVRAMSEDHTPESDRKRCQLLAAYSPQLLGNEYTRFQFQHRCRKNEVGTKQFYRDYDMDGWAFKNVEKDDVKPQLVCGEGKKSRLLDTIGTTRGFGDHDLEIPYAANIKVKPFLTSQPDVRVFDIQNILLSNNDVLVMATDGLWEKVSNEQAGEILRKTFDIQSCEEPRRYIVAAQNLIDEARGVLGEGGWRTLNNGPGSYDDISVFVIPLKEWGTCLNSVLLSHRCLRGVHSDLVDDEYDNILHTSVSQLSEEREKDELETIERCHNEVSTVDIHVWPKSIEIAPNEEELVQGSLPLLPVKSYGEAADGEIEEPN